MCTEEKGCAEKLARAFDALPDSKKEFLMGYAEGVAAMADKQQPQEQEDVSA